MTRSLNRIDTTRVRKAVLSLGTLALMARCLAAVPPAAGGHLPGTERYGEEGDLAEQTIDGIARFLLERTERSVERRAAHWNRDRSSPQAYDENGCCVLVPTLIDRRDEFSGNDFVERFTNQPHREWIFRQAFLMGRHMIGYEVQKVLAGIDWFLHGDAADGAATRPKIGMAGYVEGGLMAMYAAGLDPRIDAALVSGYFEPREGLWQEPIYRNVWALLTEFGDAEIAAMVAPKDLDRAGGERRPVVVCQHGLGRLPASTIDLEDRAYRAYAARLAERGGVVYPPYNPNAARDGDRFRVLQRMASPTKCSLFSIITGQRQRTLEWLGKQPFVDRDRIGTYGIGHIACLHAAVPAVLALGPVVSVLGTQQAPHPVHNPSSPVMLVGDWFEHPHAIDFARLPVVPSEHAVVSDVRDAGGTRVNQHNYLAHHDGRFWAMWSDGPGGPRVPPERHRHIVPGHDLAGQHVSFATSDNGVQWSEIRDLAGPPEEGFGWIARGFWIREDKLLALASRYKAPGYSGPGLQLHAFEAVCGEVPHWKHLGMAHDDALNNFAPKMLPNGQWMMTRRDHNRDIHLLFGGTEAFNRWESVPFVEYREAEMAGEEPYWWVLPDGNLVALFRDNLRSGFLFRAFSTDHGRTWSKPVRTDFPDARSKFHGLRLSDGRYLLVSNANPKRRDPMTIALSDDGLVFTKLGYLVGGRPVDYPHVIEHDGHVYVAFAGAKQTVEVLKIAIADLDGLEMPTEGPSPRRTMD